MDPTTMSSCTNLKHWKVPSLPSPHLLEHIWKKSFHHPSTINEV
jgi:hypothetical protein